MLPLTGAKVWHPLSNNAGTPRWKPVRSDIGCAYLIPGGERNGDAFPLSNPGVGTAKRPPPRPPSPSHRLGVNSYDSSERPSVVEEIMLSPMTQAALPWRRRDTSHSSSAGYPLTDTNVGWLEQSGAYCAIISTHGLHERSKQARRAPRESRASFTVVYPCASKRDFWF